MGADEGESMSYTGSVDERLAAVRTAINDILTSYQSAGTGIKNVRKAELDSLITLEQRLIEEKAATDGGGYGFYLTER